MSRWMQNRIGKTIHFARKSYLELSCGLLTETTLVRLISRRRVALVPALRETLGVGPRRR
jgi:hypothetical protein